MEQGVPKPLPKVRSSRVASLAENLAGGGAIALAIIGLAGVYPQFVASIAILAIGAAFLFEGGARLSQLRGLLEHKSKIGIHAAELGGGVNSEFVAGIAGLTLGILSIVGVVPTQLIAISILVFGAASLREGRATARISSRIIEDLDESQEVKEVANELVMSSEGVHMLIGLAAITLGIIAVIGTQPLVLSLVALLAIGFGNLLAGEAVNDKMLNGFHP